MYNRMTVAELRAAQRRHHYTNMAERQLIEAELRNRRLAIELEELEEEELFEDVVEEWFDDDDV